MDAIDSRALQLKNKTQEDKEGFMKNTKTLDAGGSNKASAKPKLALENLSDGQMKAIKGTIKANILAGDTDETKECLQLSKDMGLSLQDSARITGEVFKEIEAEQKKIEEARTREEGLQGILYFQPVGDQLFPNTTFTRAEDQDAVAQCLDCDREGNIKPISGNLFSIFRYDPYLRDCAAVADTGEVFYAENWPPFGAKNKKKISRKKQKECFEKIAERAFGYIWESYPGNWDFDKFKKRLWEQVQKNRIDIKEEFFALLQRKYIPSKNPLPQIIDNIQIDNEGREGQAMQKYAIYVFHRFFCALGFLNVLADQYEGAEYQADIMPILTGEQDVHKTSFIRWLAGALRFSDSIDISQLLNKEKDGITSLHSNLICEISEIGNKNNKDTDGLKSVISSTKAKVRLPYAREITILERRWLPIGTSNESEGLLRDQTGNRRYFILPIKNIDIAELCKTELNRQCLAYYYTLAEKQLDAAKYLEDALYSEDKDYMRDTLGIDIDEAKAIAAELRQGQTLTPSFQDILDQIIEAHKDEYCFTPSRLWQVYQANSEGKTKISERAFRSVALKCLKQAGCFSCQKWIQGKNEKVWTTDKAHTRLLPLETPAIKAMRIL